MEVKISVMFIAWIAILILLVLIGLYFKKELLKLLILNSDNTPNDIDEVKLKVYRQKELIDSVISVNDQEGYKVAEDLHDEVGPLLTALKQYLHSASASLKKGNVSKAETLLEESTAILKDAIQEIRNVSFRLSPTYIEKQGLFNAIKEYIELVSKVSSLEVEFSYPERVRMRRETGINLYKIVLELINNSLKHSGASLITVNFTEENNVLMLQYKDNGVGFNEEEIFKSISLKQGLGLNNIESRVNYINGTLTNLSRKGKGVDYTIKTIITPDDRAD